MCDDCSKKVEVLCPWCDLPINSDELGKAKIDDEPSHIECALSEMDDVAFNWD